MEFSFFILVMFVLTLFAYYIVVLNFFFNHEFNDRNEILFSLIPYGMCFKAFVNTWRQYGWRD